MLLHKPCWVTRGQKSQKRDDVIYGGRPLILMNWKNVGLCNVQYMKIVGTTQNKPY